MAQNNILPKAQSRLVDQAGQPTREFYHFFNALVNNVTAQIDDLAGVIDNLANVIVALGGDPETGAGIINVAAAVEGKADNTITITGTGSLGGGGDLTQDRYINLDGDVDTPPGVSFYGSPDGTNKGWAAFSDNFATSMDADDNVTLDLADLADSGTGAALAKITRDSKGRISGTSAATTTDLTEGGNLYFTAARVRAAVLTGLSLATNAVIAATDTVLQALGKLQAQITANLLPKGYIDGLQMQWVSGTALTLSSGAAYIEGAAAVLNVPSAIAKTGLSLAANTLYHIYPFDNAGTPDFELSTIAPAAPYNGTARSKTGDTSRRYRGSVLTDGSGNIISFSHNVQLGRIDYRSAIGGATNPLQVLNNGRATSSTNASCAAVVPITATHMVAFLFNDPSTGQTAVFAASDGAALPSAWEGFCASGAQVSGVLRLDSSQRFSYAYIATPAGLAGFTARVSGYIFES